MADKTPSRPVSPETPVQAGKQQPSVTVAIEGFLTPDVQNLRHPVAREARDLARKTIEQAGGRFISCTVDWGVMYVVLSGDAATTALKDTFMVDGAIAAELTEAQAIRRKLLRNQKPADDQKMAA